MLGILLSWSLVLMWIFAVDFSVVQQTDDPVMKILYLRLGGITHSCTNSHFSFNHIPMNLY